MDLHAQQQFDFLLQTAVERLCLRLQEHHRGAQAALEHLASPNQEQAAAAEVQQFVEALFQDFLLDNAAGACFVLQGLAGRKVPPVESRNCPNIEALLVSLAKAALGELLQRKARECLEQMAAFE